MSSSCTGLLRSFVECLRHSACMKVGEQLGQVLARRRRDAAVPTPPMPLLSPPTHYPTGARQDRVRVLGKVPDRVPALTLRPLRVQAGAGRRAHAHPGEQRCVSGIGACLLLRRAAAPADARRSHAPPPLSLKPPTTGY